MKSKHAFTLIEFLEARYSRPHRWFLRLWLVFIMLQGVAQGGESLYVGYEIDGVALDGPPVVYEGASQVCSLGMTRKL